MSNRTASQIIDALSADLIMVKLGMTERALRHAKSTGRFSGLWYEPMKSLCESHGLICPLEAFTWKKPANKLGDGHGEIQGASQ